MITFNSTAASSDPMSADHELQPIGSPVPTISVVLPVYNGEPYLAEAVDSILGQTFDDFELIAVYDASTDISRQRLEEAAQRDARVRVVEGTSRGSASTPSISGFSRARGRVSSRAWIWMDVSLPHRFARQVEYLRAHPDIAVVLARRSR